MTAKETTTDTTNPTQQPKRRRFRYNLRTLLVVITAICVWLGFKVEAARKQREAVEAIQAMRGWVRYDYLYTDNFAPYPSGKPHWLAKVFGDDFIHDVVWVSVVIGKSGDLWPHFQKLRTLRGINFVEVPISTDEFKYFAQLEDLELLFLMDTGTTRAGFEHLRRLYKLRQIAINRPITDADLEYVRSLPKLSKILLGDTELTDKSIDVFAGMTQLKELRIHGSQLSDEGAQRLQKLRPDLNFRITSGD